MLIFAAMNRLGQLLRNFKGKLRHSYIFPNQYTPSKLNEVPLKYATILKAEEWVNFVKHTATEEFKVLITHIYLTPYIFHNFVFSYTLKYLYTSSYYYI